MKQELTKSNNQLRTGLMSIKMLNSWQGLGAKNFTDNIYSNQRSEAHSALQLKATPKAKPLPSLADI